MNAFELHKVTYSYPHRRVISDTTINIFQGKLTVLLGRNGSGKSTLLRLCSKLISGYQGSIQCLGKDLSRWKIREFARVVSYLGQQHRPVFPFRVEEVMLTGRAAYINFLPTKKEIAAVDEVIQDLDLNDLRNRIYTELSGGEQQLVLLARSLVNKPSILLLDEPTNHLDFANQARIMKLAKSLVQKGVTIVSALHDPNMAFLFGDDILFVHDNTVFRDEENKPWESPILKKIIPSFDILSNETNSFIIPR